MFRWPSYGVVFMCTLYHFLQDKFRDLYDEVADVKKSYLAALKEVYTYTYTCILVHERCYMHWLFLSEFTVVRVYVCSSLHLYANMYMHCV